MTAVEDLVAFLRARIGEDEVVARGAAGAAAGPWTWDRGEFSPPLVYGNSMVGVVGSGDVDIDDEIGAHVARWDPARVLVECAAKQLIVAEAAEQAPYLESWEDVLTRLALPYADHPDYRAEWRP